MIFRWLDKRPLLVCTLAAAGLLGFFQAAFVVIWNRAFLGLEGTIGMAKLSLFLGAITIVLLLPVILLVRRRHPAWNSEERLRATWSVSFGLAVGLGAWMIADLWASGTLFSRTTAPWVAAVLGIAGGLAASGLQASARWVRFGALVTVALLLFSFYPYPPPPRPTEDAAAKPAAPAPGRPDVILVSIDTLRADHLGAYGHAPTITPAMDRVAREGVVFERGLAASPWTMPSVASIHTGLPTERHGAGMPTGAGPTFQLRAGLDNKFTTLAERFAAAGYRTRAVIANSFAGAQFGMGQGFQEMANPFEGGMMAAMMRDLPLTRLIVNLTPPEKFGDYRASGVTDTALNWLADPADTPLFLWVHYVDPHVPYTADPSLLDPIVLADMMHATQPAPRDDGTIVGEVFVSTEAVRSGMLWLGPKDRERLQQIYAGEVGYLDKHVGRLFDVLRERSAKRRVVAALTADHGEEFWDHGHFEHGHDYYRELTHVPLVFWGPETVPGARRVGGVVGLVDIGPTLLDMAGLNPEPPKAIDEGRSLTAAWGAGDLAPVPRFCGGNLYGLPSVLIEDGPWRFFLRANGVQELYDVARDPQERNNLAAQQPAVAARYQHVLQPQLTALLHTSSGDRKELTVEQLEALKALGYVR